MSFGTAYQQSHHETFTSDTLEMRVQKQFEKLNQLTAQAKTTSQKIAALTENQQARSETITVLVSSNEKLEKDLETAKGEREYLRTNVIKLSKENKDLITRLDVLTKRFEELENENKQLKGRLDELQDKNTEPSLRQVALLVEQEIWRYVLPKQNMGKSCILKSMEKWLEKNSTNEEGKEAQARWENLQRELKWDDKKHKWAIEILRTLPLDDAPLEDVNLKDAKKQLKDGHYVADAEKEACEEIIDMITKARCLNSPKRATSTRSSQPCKKLKST